MPITYAIESRLSSAEFVEVLERSGLAERRPVGDAARIDAMLTHASLIVTARDPDADNRLVGVSRCVTDYGYCCYCSDLAVDRRYQGQGIGAALVEASRAELQPGCSFFLISAPRAQGFYDRIGMPRIDRAFGWLQGCGEQSESEGSVE